MTRRSGPVVWVPDTVTEIKQHSHAGTHPTARGPSRAVSLPHALSQRLRIRCQSGMEFHIEADSVVFELLPLPPFHREAGSASHPARGRIVHPVPELQPEEFRIAESPAGHSTAGAGRRTPAASRCRRPVGHPPDAVAPVHRADTHLTEDEATAIYDGEGIGGVSGPSVTTSRYPPLGGLDGINRLIGLSTHERIRERGHHRPGILGLPSPQRQAGGGIHMIAHRPSLPQQASPVTSVTPVAALTATTGSTTSGSAGSKPRAGQRRAVMLLSPSTSADGPG